MVLDAVFQTGKRRKGFWRRYLVIVADILGLGIT